MDAPAGAGAGAGSGDSDATMPASTTSAGEVAIHKSKEIQPRVGSTAPVRLHMLKLDADGNEPRCDCGASMEARVALCYAAMRCNAVRCDAIVQCERPGKRGGIDIMM